ncbi:maleylacetoacetate isomerase [Novosphingobium lentum]|uniref:maleylacetoacetate isomerase n=1 Tax=Novosphingobium lentum TaxID=145287 RepID=UPI00082ECA29|nr:maleylacetoacetate isomerase [Novosphingobium lentum]
MTDQNDLQGDPGVVLHDYWRSSACYRVRIVLNLKGVTYRAAPVDLTQGAQARDDYLALNAQGLVPALEIDGAILTQSLAIIDYLDAKFPRPHMVPADPLRRSRTLALALVIAADVHPINNMRVLRSLREDYGASEQQVERWIHHWISAGFEALEVAAPEDGLFGGDAPDLTDVCLVPQMYNARRFEMDLQPYPRLTRIDAEMRQIAAVAAATPEAVRPG